MTPVLPAMTWPLIAYTSSFVIVWAIGMLALAARRPGHAELIRVWNPLAIFIIFGSHVACIGLIWGIMPFVPASTQFLLAIPLIGCVPVQLICSAENSVANRSGVVGVIGSLAIFFATRGTMEARLAALYIFGFGIVLLVLGDRVAATVRATVAARLSSDENARRLDQMLAEVAAERDAKTRFMAAASHDLGQPLAAAALYFDQSLRSNDELARARAVEGVRRAFTSAEQLLSHMLSHLRLEADAVEAHPSPVAIRPFLSRIAAQYEPAAAIAGIKLEVCGIRTVLNLDPSLIERAFGNLVDNAIRHSRAHRIALGARRSGGTIRLWVIDDGIGVPPIDAPHVFNDYYQAHSAANAQSNGFGLGLSSVRRLAGLMGGKADLDQRWLRGAAFYIEFPQVYLARSAVSNGIAA
ncbi:HAMP domain-containing sensor histidine kinase [Sphingomonas antarctica]|uniref:sensor histidine kinase n=1 Tax=Sphingomonas antarctica TaxID=2040274 RepID=UPI0039EC6129